MSWFRRGPSARQRRIQTEELVAYWKHQPGHTTVVCPTGCDWQRTVAADTDVRLVLETHLTDTHGIDLDADRPEPFLVLDDGTRIYHRNYGGTP